MEKEKSHDDEHDADDSSVGAKAGTEAWLSSLRWLHAIPPDTWNHQHKHQHLTSEPTNTNTYTNNNTWIHQHQHKHLKHQQIIIIAVIKSAPDPWEYSTPTHAGPHYILEQDIPQIRRRQYLTQMD